MAHWGWWWKVKNKAHIPKKLCSNMIKIDSFVIYKKGITHGFQVAPLDIKAMPMLNHLVIIYRNQKKNPYQIPVEKIPCNYGGIRCYFKCPLCNKRMRILYLAENSIFLCRKCLNLGYITQRWRPSIRTMIKHSEMKRQIKNLGGDLDINKKPPRMRTSTFE